MMILRAVLVPLALCLPALAGPVFYQYNLAAAGLANADSDISQTDPAWTGIWGGAGFTKGNLTVDVASKVQTTPAMSTDTRLAAVPFSVNADPGAESWSGYKAWQNSGSTDPTAPTNVSIAANSGKTEMVFLLMNTFWGASGKAAVEVTLAFQSGAQLSFSLVGDTDIRDHHDSQLVLGRKVWSTVVNPVLRTNGNGSGQVTVNESTREFQYDNLDHRVYRDVITLLLPPSYWGEMLSSIYVNDKGPNDTSGDPNASRVWLWAATTMSADAIPEPVPEPATGVLVGAGLGLAAWLTRRRKAA